SASTDLHTCRRRAAAEETSRKDRLGLQKCQTRSERSPTLRITAWFLREMKSASSRVRRDHRTRARAKTVHRRAGWNHHSGRPPAGLLRGTFGAHATPTGADRSCGNRAPALAIPHNRAELTSAGLEMEFMYPAL